MALIGVSVNIVPVTLPNSIFTTDEGFNNIGINTLWGQQDIALPGNSTGDGVADNGSIPLRMVLRPNNASTHVVSASNFLLEKWPDGFTEGILQSTDDAYLPTSQTFKDNLYPGYDGGSVFVYEWVNGANGFLNDADSTAATISLDALSTTNNPMFEKIQIFDFNFDTNSAGTGGSIGNKVVVLGYVKPDYNVGLHVLTALNYVENVILKKFKIQIQGSSTPITLDTAGNSTNVNTEETNTSFNLTIEAEEKAAANFTIIPYIKPNLLTGGNDPINNGYVYSESWNPDASWSASVTFEQSQVWTEQSYAIPEFSNSTDNRPFFFWIIPRPGFVISRHNLSVKQFAGTGDTVGYMLNTAGLQEYTLNSNVSINPPFQLGKDKLFGTDLPSGYVSNWRNSFGQTISNAISYQELTTSSYELPGNTTSYFGKTNYNNINTTLTSNISSELESTLINFNNLVQSNEVSLIDINQYTLGTPVLGQLISQFQPNINAQTDFMSNDIGADFVNGVMPNQYCTSDWNKNKVLVMIDGFNNYIPGLNPNNIKIQIEGKATPDDGQICMPFSVNIQGGTNSTS